MTGPGRRVFVAEAEFADGGDGFGGGSPSMPPRPSLPPTLGCALSLWGSCAAFLAAAEAWDAGLCLAAGAAAVVAAAVAAIGLWRGRAVQAWAVLVGALLGAACALGCAAGLHVEVDHVQGNTGPWRFEAVSDGSTGPYGASVFARAELPGDGRAVVLVRLAEGEEPPRFGEAFEAEAALSAVPDASSSYCWRQGAVASARADDVRRLERHNAVGVLVGLRGRVIEALDELGGGDGPAVLAALVCGWRAALDEGDVYDAFKVTGLAHLVAVSGAHLSIVSASVAALLRLLRLPRAAAAAVQALLLLCYLVLAAAPPSAVRAAVMAFAGMLAFTARRRPAALSALAACMLGCIALDPLAALSVSFALSALSTLGIVLFSGLCSAWIGRFAPALPRFARDALSLTCASSILAVPLSASLFSMLPLVAPAANIAAAPLFPPVCAGGLVAAAASLALPCAAPVLLGAASAGASALAGLVRLLAAVPHASAPADIPLVFALGASCVLGAALWMAWPRPRVKAACAVASSLACLALAAGIVLPRLSGDEIVMLDVGQGDAFLVRSQGAALLIDTGNQERLLREALARHGVLRLDAVVVTHGDDDHMGALASLDGVAEVGRVLVANDALACPCAACARLRDDARKLVGGDGAEGLEAGDGLHVGAFDLTVVWPESFSDEGGNADSLCLLAEADVDGDGAGDWTALFVGDAERDQLARLVESGAVGNVDVYKVGHHGSKNAVDGQVAAALSPSIALVSVGAGNRYGHPSAQTVAALEEAGALVLRTDEAGDVSCKMEADRIAVDTLR